MSWFNSEGALPSHVLWSRVRYIRNLSSAFYKSDEKTILEAQKKLFEIMQGNGFRKEDIPDGSQIKLRSLAEKQFIPYSLEHSSIHDVYFNEPCSLIISFGGKDIFDIRALLSGRALKDALNIASQAEELLDGDFDFAYSETYGYLSPSPKDCGSGAELSCALFLPAARYFGFKDELCLMADSFGATLLPFLSDARNHGDIFILSYTLPLGADEKFEAERFDSLIGKIVEREGESERIIFDKERIINTERAARALGELNFARRLCEDELLYDLSAIRLALLLYPEDATELEIAAHTLDKLLASCLSCSTLEGAGVEVKDIGECDGLRASLVRRILAESKAALPAAT